MENNKTFTDKKPPVLKTWKQLYGFVFLHLLALIVLYYIFTIYFR